MCSLKKHKPLAQYDRLLLVAKTRENYNLHKTS